MIYLIDDDEIQNTINTRIVEIVYPEGEIKVFRSAASALEDLVELGRKADKPRPMVIFLDLNMPEMNGWDFMMEYESNEFPWPVFVLTSSINEQDKVRAVEFTSARGFLSKPLTVKGLAEIIDKYKNIRPN